MIIKLWVSLSQTQIQVQNRIPKETSWVNSGGGFYNLIPLVSQSSLHTLGRAIRRISNLSLEVPFPLWWRFWACTWLVLSSGLNSLKCSPSLTWSMKSKTTLAETSKSTHPMASKWHLLSSSHHQFMIRRSTTILMKGMALWKYTESIVTEVGLKDFHLNSSNAPRMTLATTTLRIVAH